jgi:hypothetical protein
VKRALIGNPKRKKPGLFTRMARGGAKMVKGTKLDFTESSYMIAAKGVDKLFHEWHVKHFYQSKEFHDIVGAWTQINAIIDTRIFKDAVAKTKINHTFFFGAMNFLDKFGSKTWESLRKRIRRMIVILNSGHGNLE